MYKKTMTYTDYNGAERTEDFYFNLTKAELMEMELSAEGGFEQQVRRIVAAKDTPQIVKVFKQLLLKSYGVKSDDGRRFMKSEEISKAFSETPAYSELFILYSTDDKAAAEFINNVVPKDVADEAKKAQEKEENKVVAMPGSAPVDVPHN